MNIGKMISQRRKQLGMTLEEVGKAVGVGKSTVRKWETGSISNMRRDRIAKLAAVLQLKPIDFIVDCSECESSININIKPVEKHRIPFLGEIACGSPIYTDQGFMGYVEAGAEIKADFCLRAKGDSMIGARIHSGDLVFCRKQDTVENGDIAVVIIEDEATLKRFYFYPGKNLVILRAENTDFEDLMYSDSDLEKINIIGKAIFFQSDIK